MVNRDRPSEAEIEDALETLLADCDEALARGEDPTALLERLKDLPAEARHQFSDAYESLRTVKDLLPTRLPSFHFPRPFGKFRLLQLLGQGGFGLVFLAEDPSLGRKVALKVPRLHQLVAPDSAERFAREARAAAALEHPHLVQVFEIGQAEGLTYLASAYCEGPTLSQWLKAQSAPVPIRAAAEVVEVLARAAAYMHGQGVIHRDLKPSNVLLFPKKSSVETNGTGMHSGDASDFTKPLDAFIAKITDFGLARQDDQVLELTRTGMMAGTAAYMSPEQAWGSSKDIGSATDIYSLGAVLYELLTGRPPFHGDNDLETLRRAREEEPIPPRKLRSGTPRDLETICLKCLEKRPARRYSSMTALADDLQRFLHGRAITARPAGWIDRTDKWVRRQPIVAALVGLACLLVATLVTGSTWFGWREYQYRRDLEEALQDTQKQKNLAEEREWLVRNQLYATQIRDCAMLKNTIRYAGMKKLLLDQKPAPGQKDVRGFEWHYLWHYGNESWLAANSRVNRLAYSHDGTKCAAGCADFSIRIFDTSSGKLLATLPGHNSPIFTLDFTAEDTQLISTTFAGNRDGRGFFGECILQDASNGGLIHHKSVHQHRSGNGSYFFAVAPAARVLFFTDRDKPNVLSITRLDSGEQQILQTEKPIVHVVTTPNADCIALIHDGLLELRNPFSKKLIASCGFHGWPHVASFSDDGTSLALSLGDKTGSHSVQILNVPSLTKRTELPFASVPHRPVFDWQGKRLAVHSSANQFQVFDIKSGALLGDYRLAPATAGFAFSPNGEDLAISAMDGGVRTGKNLADRPEYLLPGPLSESEAWCLAFSKDGKTLAVGYDHDTKEDPETLKLWDLRTKKAITLPGHNSTVMALAVSPDGTSLATAGHDRSVRFWDLATGKLKSEMNEHLHPVRALAFSPDGREVASAGGSVVPDPRAASKHQFVKIWDMKTKVLTKNWHAHDEIIRALTFSPDGTLLISASTDHTIKIWDAKVHTLLHTLGDKRQVQGLACSPKGDLLASAHENNNVNLWDPAKGVHVKTLLGHTGKVRCVAFSPDGKTLASGGEDKVVRLWHILTGQELLALPVDHFINNLAFDRDGKTLAAALHNGNVKLWKVD